MDAWWYEFLFSGHPNKMFRFPLTSVSLVKVGRSVVQEKKN